jgi:hypothetical protein
MMRFRLRTLLILLAILPPFLAWWGWPAIQRLFQPPQPVQVSTEPSISVNAEWEIGLGADMVPTFKQKP